MRLFLRFLVALCAIALAATTLPAVAQEPAEPLESPRVRVIELDPGQEATGRHLAYLANRSRDRIQERCGVIWEDQVTIVWCTEREYLERTGFRPENTAAAAAPWLLTIYINESAWLRSTVEERERIMTHEMGHLLLGALPGGKDLPLWANEGIVMHLADQWSWDEQLLLLTAHATGSLPRLADLEEEFPRTGNMQSVAYRTAYAAVEVMAQSYGDESGEVSRLVRRLADPVWGPSVAEELRDPWRRDGWQIAMERSLGSRYSTGVVVLTSTGAIFLLIAILVLIAWVVVRRRRAARARQEEAEREPWEESLTDQDIADIYGDREDRWKLEDEPKPWQPDDEDGEGWKRR